MANFNLVGKTHSFSDLLITAVIRGMKNDPNSLRIFERMLKGPQAFEVENLLISLDTSNSLNSYNKMWRLFSSPK